MTSQYNQSLNRNAHAQSRAVLSQADTDRLLASVSDALDSRLQPIREQQQQFRETLDQLSQPVTDAQSAIGHRAPGHIRGPLPSECERGGYQMRRAAAFQRGQINHEDAKYEISVSEKLKDIYVQRGGLSLAGDSSILVPLGTDLIPDEGSESHNLRTELKQSMAASVSGAHADQIRWLAQRHQHIRQALSIYDDSALGVFVGEGSRGEMIELLRNREVFSRAGASTIALPPSGRLPYPKQTGAATAYWVGENQQITASEQTSGSINLIAKKLAALTKLPNELVRFGTPSVEAFIRNDLSRVMALEADLAMLEGVGSTTKVKGLLNYAGINTHTATTTGTDGDTLEPKDGQLAIAELEDDNHDTSGMSWVMRYRMWQNIANRRAGSGFAENDGAGPFLFTVNRNDIRQGLPMMWEGHPLVTSNQVSNTRVKGSGTDLTYILGGLFEHWLIGRVGVLEFATSTSGDTAFQNDQTWLRVIQHLDAAPRHENAFVLIDDIDMDLPA